MVDLPRELAVRRAAFEWLRRQVDLFGDVLSRQLLAEGFEFEGQRIPLLSPQGIFTPKALDLPISIATAPAGPYDDAFSRDGGTLLYRYRGTDPHHRDNVLLRRTKELGIPLCYFHGVVPGRYLAVWPVFVQGDNPAALTFTVAVDDAAMVAASSEEGVGQVDEEAVGRRRYLTAVVQRRLHQRGFRERVLRAYREHCAVCRLAHRELLDSAHIIPDGEPDGDPIVPNGLALCSLHHAAFDGRLIGIRPDYVIEVRRDVLLEHDGPMLIHGLQALHQIRIEVPHAAPLRPDPERLDVRYRRFREAA